MIYECLWYDGDGSYRLLDFDPNGLSDLELKEEVINHLKIIVSPSIPFGLSNDYIKKACETVYLVDVNNLKRVFKEPYKELHHISIE